VRVVFSRRGHDCGRRKIDGDRDILGPDTASLSRSRGPSSDVGLAPGAGIGGCVRIPSTRRMRPGGPCGLAGPGAPGAQFVAHRPQVADRRRRRRRHPACERYSTTTLQAPRRRSRACRLVVAWRTKSANRQNGVTRLADSVRSGGRIAGNPPARAPGPTRRTRPARPARAARRRKV